MLVAPDTEITFPQFNLYLPALSAFPDAPVKVKVITPSSELRRLIIVPTCTAPVQPQVIGSVQE
ncbi:MAG: hypothetical protein LBU27_02930 [Candidatus Peribacteria bacterium]|nr:hypothetical protein [Candidatus Peribacteria bacterium]